MRIYVGNLAFKAEETDIRQAFEAHGQVSEVSIIRDRETGTSRGFGFVDMPSNQEGTSAIEALNGKDVQGRKLVVNEARPRSERGDGGGGGGFRRGPRE